MKRGKQLLLLACVLAAVVAVTLIVQTAVTGNEQAKTAQQETAVTFLQINPEAVNAISWTYNGQTVNLARTDGVWTNADDLTFPVAQQFPEAMLAALQSVTASRAFAAGDLSEYGLDAPAYTIVIDADTVTTLTAGNASGISGETYTSIGDGKIYLVAGDLLKPFACGLTDILQKEAVPDMTALTGMQIDTAAGKTNIVYLENSDYSYTNRYHWFLTDNGKYTALGSAADTLADSLKALSWLSCVNHNATADDLKTYGLDAPNAVVTLRYTQAADGAADTAAANLTADTAVDATANAAAADTAADAVADPSTAADDTAAAESAFVLEIGGFTDGGYYARVQGSNMVYMIDASLAQSILNANLDTLQPNDVCLLDWSTVTSFTVTLDGATYAFERDSKDVTDADGNVTQQDVFLMNGTEVDGALVTAVFDKIYAMQTTGTADQAPGQAEIAFTFRRNTETFPEITLSFYRLNSASCIAGLNGETRLTVARADVVALVEAVNAIILQ